MCVLCALLVHSLQPTMCMVPCVRVTRPRSGRSLTHLASEIGAAAEGDDARALSVRSSPGLDDVARSDAAARESGGHGCKAMRGKAARARGRRGGAAWSRGRRVRREWWPGSKLGEIRHRCDTDASLLLFLLEPPAAGALSRPAATPGVKGEIHAHEGVFFS